MTSRVYRQVAKSAGVPLIGMGGITTWQDAAEFILCGASAVAIGTALFVNPNTPNELLSGLEDYCRSQGVSRLADLVGTLQL
jgi:dihydroorotate dehydrogenase (NAD+) catalytic subunit